MHGEHSNASTNGLDRSERTLLNQLHREWFGEAGYDGLRLTVLKIQHDVGEMKSMLRNRNVRQWIGVLAWVAIAAKLWLESGR